MDPPSLAGNCRPLESKVCVEAIDVDKEKTLCKHRDVKFSVHNVDSVETGSMQFVGRQEAWARLAAYQQVQRRREKNLRLCSYRLRRSVKNDPLPLSVHTGVTRCWFGLCSMFIHSFGCDDEWDVLSDSFGLCVVMFVFVFLQFFISFTKRY